ncbi:MAG: DUF3820 family protein [Gammaproteobacteria bacterium]|nr:DUF3820 family protein [Gammaproteobacteria bacterium]
MFEPENIKAVIATQMPFGKYKGRALIDLPENYLLWFARQGFPEGKLGLLMQLVLEIKVNNLQYLVNAVKTGQNISTNQTDDQDKTTKY